MKIGPPSIAWKIQYKIVHILFYAWPDCLDWARPLNSSHASPATWHTCWIRIFLIKCAGPPLRLINVLIVIEAWGRKKKKDMIKYAVSVWMQNAFAHRLCLLIEYYAVISINKQKLKYLHMNIRVWVIVLHIDLGSRSMNYVNLNCPI